LFNILLVGWQCLFVVLSCKGHLRNSPFLLRKSSGVTTDSRRVERNNIYFALRGENFDGNMFAAQALAQGALAAVVDDAACGGFCLLVLDID